MFERVVAAVELVEPSAPPRGSNGARTALRRRGPALACPRGRTLAARGSGPLATSMEAAAGPGEKEAAERLKLTSRQIADAGINVSSEVRVSCTGRVAVEIAEEVTTLGR